MMWLFPVLSWSLAIIVWATVYYHKRSHDGHRRAAEDDHSGAAGDAGTAAAFQALLASFAGDPVPPAGTPAGDGSDPRAGDGPGLDPEAKAPDQIEPIYGWRAWTAKPDGTLYATNQETTWLPGHPTVAYCRVHADLFTEGLDPHSAPDQHCSCGLYAGKHVSQIMYAAGKPFVWGEVALWGKVILCSSGYRAQFGYPARNLKLYDPTLHRTGKGRKQAERLAARVSELYGVEVTLASKSEVEKVLGARRNTPPLAPTVTTSGSIGTFSGSSSNMHPGNIWTTSAATTYQPTTPRVVPPHPQFQGYPSHAAFQAARQQAMLEVAAHIKAEAERKRAEARKRIAVPKPGEAFLDMGQARAAYEFDNPADDKFPPGG